MALKRNDIVSGIPHKRKQRVILRVERTWMRGNLICIRGRRLHPDFRPFEFLGVSTYIFATPPSIEQEVPT